MDHEGDGAPPFWSQPQRRRSCSPTLNPVALIIMVPILAFLLIAFLLIPLVSNVLKAPTSIKKGWDSLNILLVLLAILCGVFLRQQNDDDASVLDPVTEHVSHDYSGDQEVGSGAGKLMKSSSSYPDLRPTQDRAYRFYDDSDADLNIYSQDHNLPTCVSTYPAITIPGSLPEPEAAAAPQQAPPQQPKEDEAQQLKEDEPAPAPQQQEEAEAALKESMKRRGAEGDKTDTRPLPCSPPPLAVQRRQENTEMLQRKKKEIATAIASLYYRTKKNKKKLKIRNIYDDATMIRSASSITPSMPPPPPPPPPPSVFHNMFKKGNKSKKIHSVSQSVPPPPNSIFNNIFKNTTGTSKRFHSTPTPPPPPPPPRSSILNTKPAKTIKRTSSPPPLRKEPQSRRGKPPLPTNYYQSTGAKSPVVPVPPPPPFKMQQAKFQFVRMENAQNSQSPCVELEEDVEVASTSETQTPRAFCPCSPDVNTKADNFIARLRDEWRLEKMNSIRAKQ